MHCSASSIAVRMNWFDFFIKKTTRWEEQRQNNNNNIASSQRTKSVIHWEVHGVDL